MSVEMSTTDPAAAAAFRVPRSELDALFVRGEQTPESRVGTGIVVSVDSSNTCTVLINDEEVTGVMWLGRVPPQEDDVVVVEVRGDLLCIPALNDIDTFVEGMSQTVEHIVSADDPGSPPPEQLQVGGSMRSVDAWSFWGPDTSNWARELSASGTGMRCYQITPPVLVSRNLITIPSAEAGIGPDDKGNSWTPSTAASVETTPDVAYHGSVSFKATWKADPSSSGISLKITGLTSGQPYTLQAMVLVPTGSPGIYIGVSSMSGSATMTTKDAWTAMTLTFTATATEHTIFVATAPGVPTTPGTAYFDAVSLVQGSTPLAAYFDGGTIDTSTDTYNWLGTAHLSASEHYNGALPVSVLLGTNLFVNPSFETNTTGWGPVRSTIARTASASAVSGGYVLRVTNDGTANTHYVLTAAANRLPVSAGQIYTLSGYARRISGDGLDYVAKVWFYDAGGAVVGSTLAGAKTVLPMDGSWVRLTLTFTVPSTAGIVTMGPAFSTSVVAADKSNSDVWELDAVMIQLSSELVAYFDGSKLPDPSGYYNWTGAAHASTSEQRTAPPGAPPGSTGILWSEQTFDVEPGQSLSWSMELAEIISDTTAQLYVLYGGVGGSAPLPTDADVLAAAVGSAVALLGTVSTVSGTLTIPETVTLPVSGTVPPATVRIGVRLVGTGVSQVLATAASATLTPKGWPLGSQWMDPDAPEGGLTTFQEMAIGNLNTILTNNGSTDAPIPSAKKVTITAPPDTGGIAVVTFTGTFRIRTSTAATYLTLWDGTKEVGLVYFASGVVDAGWYPFVLRGTIEMTPGQEITITPRYRYSSTSTTVPHELHRMQTMAEFYPGAVRSGGTADAGTRYWDGDSWRPDTLKGAVIDLSKDASTAPPTKTNTTTTISRSASTLHSGAKVTLTATVTAGATGSVTFYRGSSSSGPWTSLGAVTLSGGKATKTYEGVGGTAYFKATYGGSTTHNTSTSATTSVYWQKKVTKTINISCSWAQAYEGSGSKLSGTSHDGAVAQGQYSSSDGNVKSLLRFDHSAIPSSATVTYVGLVCKSGGWSHWYNNSGGTLVVGDFWDTPSEPATWPSSKVDTGDGTYAVDTGGWTVNLTSWATNELESPSFSGLTIGPGDSTSLAYYGYSATPAKDQFTLKVTYENWE